MSYADFEMTDLICVAISCVVFISESEAKFLLCILTVLAYFTIVDSFFNGCMLQLGLTQFCFLIYIWELQPPKMTVWAKSMRTIGFSIGLQVGAVASFFAILSCIRLRDVPRALTLIDPNESVQDRIFHFANRVITDQGRDSVAGLRKIFDFHGRPSLILARLEKDDRLQYELAHFKNWVLQKPSTSPPPFKQELGLELQSLADVYLVAGDLSDEIACFKVHKFALAKSSRLFRVLFEDPNYCVHDLSSTLLTAFRLVYGKAVIPLEEYPAMTTLVQKLIDTMYGNLLFFPVEQEDLGVWQRHFVLLQMCYKLDVACVSDAYAWMAFFNLHSLCNLEALPQGVYAAVIMLVKVHFGTAYYPNTFTFALPLFEYLFEKYDLLHAASAVESKEASHVALIKVSESDQSIVYQNRASITTDPLHKHKSGALLYRVDFTFAQWMIVALLECLIQGYPLKMNRAWLELQHATWYNFELRDEPKLWAFKSSSDTRSTADWITEQVDLFSVSTP